MYNVLGTPIFGIVITIVFFNLGVYIQKKTKNPLFNPLLIAIITIIVFLGITKIPYEKYKYNYIKSSFIHFICSFLSLL